MDTSTLTSQRIASITSFLHLPRNMEQLPPRGFRGLVSAVLLSRSLSFKAAVTTQQRERWEASGCTAAICTRGEVIVAAAAAQEVLDAALDLAAEAGRAPHLKRLAWDLQVVPSHDVNAATDGVGRLLVTTGLPQHLEEQGGAGEGQLAAVLAHEVAHNAAQHVARIRAARASLLPSAALEYAAARLVGPGIALSAITAASARALQGLASTLSPRPMQLAHGCRRGRSLESEADVLALHILARSGRLPGHLIAYLRGVQQWEEAAGQAGAGVHPPARERIQALRAHLPAAAAVLQGQSPCYAAWRRCSRAAAAQS